MRGTGLVLAAGVLALSFVGGGCGETAGGWEEHRDARGFKVRCPEGWQVTAAEEGFIVVRSEESRAVVAIAPFYMREPGTASGWIAKAPEVLAALFPQGRVTKFEQRSQRPDEAVGSMSYGADGEASLLCSVYGPSGMLYAIGAPKETFGQLKGTMVEILRSFSFTTPEKGAAGPASGGLSYAKWQDPVESAFTVELPKGWKIEGGLIRRSAVDPRVVFRATAPDETAVLFCGDAEVPAFTEPTPTLAMAGFVEGSTYSPGYGEVWLVARYRTGEEFAREYVSGRIAPLFENLSVTGVKARPDVAQAIQAVYGRFGGTPYTQLTCGEATFTCAKGGRALVGYCFAGTQITRISGTGIWKAEHLIGYLAVPEKEEVARQAMGHVVKTFAPNPQWVAMQQGLTANVSKIVSQTHEAISRTITEGYEQRQATQDDHSRKWSNMMLGQTDVQDEATGETYKVANGHNYYWRKGDTIVGTDTYTRPDIDFTPLVEW
ncbi:MAG: hypothetical protein V2A58_03945 [Planctomycetota bacterium]